VAAQKEEYVLTEVFLGDNKASTIDRQNVMNNISGNYKFKLSFDNELRAGHMAMGEIMVTDLNDNPVQDLEPIMGAFAHIVGFFEDMKTIVHIHPMGKEPTAEIDRGGPVLQFHIEAKHRGFIRLFAQFKINGEEIIVPFGVTVK